MRQARGQDRRRVVSGPVTIATIDGWRLTRYEYDGAPLQVEREPRTRGDEIDLEVDKDGDLSIDVRYSTSGYGGSCSHAVSLPRTVLVALLRDAIARGLLAVEELTP